MTPRPYQITGAEFLATNRRALLADEMRVGKTPQAILACDLVNAKKILVVCPAIATEHWVREFGAWSPDREQAIIITKKAPGPDFQGVAVLSYNRLVMHRADLSLQHWDVVILDEAHYVKSPTAKRTKAALAKGGVGWNTDYIWCLTGTPEPNHFAELWPVLRAFGRTKLTYDEFATRYCYYDEQIKRVWGNRPAMRAEALKLLEPIMLRRTRSEVAPEIPPIQFYPLNLSRESGLDFTSADTNFIDTGNRIEVANAMVPGLVEEIEDHILNGGLDCTVVFAYHKEPIAKLVHELNYGSGIKTESITGDTSPPKRLEIMARFHAGTTKVLVCQIIAAGTAIDLSRAHHGFFLEFDFVPGNNEQAANRLVSLQKGIPVTFDYVTWPGTILDGVQRTLARKIRTAVVDKGN